MESSAAPVEPSQTPSVATVTAPSGLSGTVRRLKIKELNLLADRKLARRGTSITELIRSVWVETLDPGPYRSPLVSWPEDSRGQLLPRWEDVLLGDRTAILLAIRELSRGPDLSFEVTCTSHDCRRPIPWTLDTRQLERQPLSQEAVVRFQEGENLFFRHLPVSGKQVGFKLLTGADEAQVARIGQSDGTGAMVTATLLLRLPYLEGTNTPRERRDFIEEMDAGDAEWLQGQWEAAEAAVQSEIEVECPNCWRLQTVSIPFDADFFWRRSSRRRRT